MNMELQTGIVESVTKSELLDLEIPSWNRQRSSSELLGFVARRESEIANLIDQE